MQHRLIVKVSNAESQIIDDRDRPLFTSISEVGCCTEASTTVYRGDEGSDNVLVVYTGNKLHMRDHRGARIIRREEEMLTDNPRWGR